MNKVVFNKLTKLFEDNGFNLYLVGGAVRDYLLGIDFTDYDMCTDATPDEMKKFLIGDTKYTFAKFGTVNLKIDGIRADITTLRLETGYADFRHPNKVVFTRNLEEDYRRRDFTINALYMDKNYNIIDFVDGQKDLKDKIIRFIGDPELRIKEDPLRIIRAQRFESKLGFKYEKNTEEALHKLSYLVDELNPEKVKAELAKLNK